jgi:hypothetical protein
MNIEEAIGHQLRKWGLTVKKIPESQEKGDNRPDYEVKCNMYTYLIEVKSKEDDKKEVEEKKEILSQGEIYGKHKALIRNNTISGVIRDACDQLKNYGKDEWYRIVWLCAIDDDQIAKFEQFKAAIYGTTQMFDLDGDAHYRPCYFYRNSDFFRYHSTLDAAIVSTLDDVELCLNPFSTKTLEFKKTTLVQLFKDSVCDPIKDESEGCAYIVDSDVDRENEEAVMSYLRNKYSAPKLSKIDMGWQSGSILI